MREDIRFYWSKCGKGCIINPGLWGILLFRFGHRVYYSKGRKFNPLWYIYLILNNVFMHIYKIELPCTCYIGKGLFLPHPSGLVLGGHCRVGNNVTLGPWVVLGHNFDHKDPLIEDDCYIGPKATVLGGIVIGKGTIIGANTVVTRSVPAGGRISLRSLLNTK